MQAGGPGRYVRSVTENGRTAVHYVCGEERELVVVSGYPIAVDAAIRRHQLACELAALRGGQPNPHAYWKSATARLQVERLTTAQKYVLKRKALGSALRDAEDPRQLPLLLVEPKPGGG